MALFFFNFTHFSDKLRGLNSSLRGALQTQAGRFVARFHDERRNKLSLILDNEVWKQVADGQPIALSRCTSESSFDR